MIVLGVGYILEAGLHINRRSMTDRQEHRTVFDIMGRILAQEVYGLRTGSKIARDHE